MAYRYIKLARDGPVATITLNRPERLNAIGIHVVHDMQHALDEIEKDPSIRVYIVTGAPRKGGRPCFWHRGCRCPVNTSVLSVQ